MYSDSKKNYKEVLNFNKYAVGSSTDNFKLFCVYHIIEQIAKYFSIVAYQDSYMKEASNGEK